MAPVLLVAVEVDRRLGAVGGYSRGFSGGRTTTDGRLDSDRSHRRRAHVDERDARVGAKLNRGTDDGPVLGSTVELLIAPTGATGLRDPDLSQEFVLA